VNFNECLRLGDPGVIAFANWIPSRLQTLHLLFWGCHQLGDAGAAALAGAIPQDLHNLVLGFNGTAITDYGVAALATSLPSELRVLKLFLSNCRVGDAGVAAVAARVPFSMQQLELRFEGCASLSDAGMASLAHKLLQMQSSLCMRLAGTSVSDQVRDIFLSATCNWEALQRWYSLDVDCFAVSSAWRDDVAHVRAAEPIEDNAVPGEMEDLSVDVAPSALKRSSSSDNVAGEAHALDQGSWQRGQGLIRLSTVKRCATAPF
jgi:hypothetical protein